MRKASLRPDTQQGAESTIASSRPSTRNTTIKDGIIIRWENDTRPLLRRPRTSSKFLTRSECSSGGLFLSFLASMHTLFCSDVWGWHSRDHSQGSPILQLTVRKHFLQLNLETMLSQKKILYTHLSNMSKTWSEHPQHLFVFLCHYLFPSWNTANNVQYK